MLKCQGLLLGSFGAVSITPVAIAMPRMTKGNNMPRMPTMAMGSLRGDSPPFASLAVLKYSSGSSSAEMKPFLLVSPSFSPPSPSFALTTCCRRLKRQHLSGDVPQDVKGLRARVVGTGRKLQEADVDIVNMPLESRNGHNFWVRQAYKVRRVITRDRNAV